jgi:L-amino acid N-acyltransferase YncA
MSILIRVAKPDDATAITDIYNHYIRNDIATFEEDPITVEAMAARMADVAEKSLPWLVAVDDETILGYAYATSWKLRSAYRFSVESTIYLAHAAMRRGIGADLYGALIAELRAHNIHVVIGGVSLPNEASAKLHEKLGFKKIAQFEQVGYKFGRWIDVGYWELLL